MRHTKIRMHHEESEHGDERDLSGVVMRCRKIKLLKDTVQSGILTTLNCKSNVFILISVILSLPVLTISTLKVMSNALSIGIVSRTAAAEVDGSNVRGASVEVDVSDNGGVGGSSCSSSSFRSCIFGSSRCTGTGFSSTTFKI